MKTKHKNLQPINYYLFCLKKVNMIISKIIGVYYLILKLISEIYIKFGRLNMINNKKIS